MKVQILEEAFGDYAELEGSPKQIPWAESIRDKMIDNLEELTKKTKREFKSTKNPSSKKDLSKTLELLEACIDALLYEETSAKWFIDNRNIKIWNLVAAIETRHRLGISNRIDL